MLFSHTQNTAMDDEVRRASIQPFGGWSPSTPAHHELQTDFGRAVLPELHLLARQHKGPVSAPVLRVAQLDAGRLDQELAGMLQGQLSKAFTFFRPGLLTALQPELTLVLDLQIFGCSVWMGRPTPGASLMNLRYRNERATAAAGPSLLAGDTPHVTGWQAAGRTGVEGPGLTRGQRTFYGLFILGRYGWARLHMLLDDWHWRRNSDDSPSSWGARGWRIMQRTETALRLASVANLLVFLRRGVYRSISERVLGARLVLQQASMARALSFEYLNRQLVWQELSELLLFLLPLLNVTQLRRRLLDHLPRIAAFGAGSLSGSAVSPEGGAASSVCGICSSSAILQPYAGQPCGHYFCYYCVRSRTEADAHYKCPICQTRIEAIKPCMQSLGAARQSGS